MFSLFRKMHGIPISTIISMSVHTFCSKFRTSQKTCSVVRDFGALICVKIKR